MTVIRCAVLGTLRVTRDGDEIAIRSERQRALLTALVAASPETLSVDRLSEAIWTGEPPSDPASAVQTHVSRLRRAIGGGILTEAAGYRLDPSVVTTDIADFESATTEALHLLEDDPRTALAALDVALADWRGDPFDGFADREVIRPVAVRCAERRQQAEEAIVEARLAIDDSTGAVALAEVIAARDPMRERSTALLMRALYASGRATEALEAFNEYRARVGTALGIEPSQALRDLESAIIRHELPSPSDPTGTRAPDPRRVTHPTPVQAPGSSVPTPVTQLVGRGEDLARVAAMVGEHRATSIVGPGGVGKTRLAQHVALSVAGRYPDGIWWCDVTGDRPRDVADHLVAVLGVAHRSDTTVTERLVEFLRPHSTLIVLDSCDHLVDAVAEIVGELTARTTEVDFLVTSREALGIDAEHRWVLEPLGVGGDVTNERSPAHELFMARARAVAPRFTPTETDARHIDEICARLDGLPLAIELAAARMSAMTTEEIASGLDARFELLRRHRRATGRQRSLRATFDWSFDLLESGTGAVFLSASVFTGPFDVAALRAVHADTDTSVEAALFDLVERSLVQRVEEGDGAGGVDGAGTPHYRLLETARHYGRDRLSEVERRELAQRHASHVVARARQWRSQLVTADETTAAKAASAASTDIRAAHRHMLETGDLDALLELWSSLFWFCWGRARSDLHLLAQECVQAVATAELDDPRVAIVASSAGMGAWQRGDFDTASELAELGLQLAPDDPAHAHWCEEVLGDVALLRGRLDDAVSAYTAGAEHAELAGDALRRVVLLADRALPLAYRGDHDEASTSALEALEAAKRIGQPTALAMSHYCAGEVLLDVEPEAARRHLERAIELAHDADLVFVHGIALVSAVTLQGRSGDLVGALERYPALVEHWARAGSWSQQWTTLRNLAELLVRAGHDRAAAVLLGASWSPADGSAVFGADEERLGLARETIVGRLGERETLEASALGATFDGPRAVRFARSTLAELAQGRSR